MTWISVVILAIVEGLAEFLPISSTGHMILASAMLKLPQTEFLSSFEIVIQVGAILAILSKYWQFLWSRKDLWRLLVAAFIPTSIIGFLGYKLVKEFFLGNVAVTMLGLLIGGVILLGVEKWIKGKQTLDQLSVKRAAFIGLLQAIAIIPGVSRSASTIVAGELVGLSRKEAVKFSFLLGLPVLAAASGYDLLKSGFSFSATQWGQLALGMFAAFIVARITVDWLVSFVEKHSLAVFGWYRIGLALIYFTSLWVIGR